MTPLIVKLDPVLARKLARSADSLSLTHELGLEAVRLFVRSVCPPPMPRPRRRKRR
jgi:hypothetical protein